MVTRHKLGILAVAAAACACHADLAIQPPNQIPVADARVLRNGQSYNARMDGGAAELAFDYNGSPVTVTLDGTQSSDSDGTIASYLWLSATPPPDGGSQLPDGATMLRYVPPGDAPNWPGTAAQPQVQLGEGIWSFSLWVTDDKGAISQPDTIKITVGMVVDPAIKVCADKVLSTEPTACSTCLCKNAGTVGDMCSAAVTADKCDQTCWDLVNCIAAKCPNFAMMAAMMPPDYSCVTTNCMPYVGGSTGATPVGPCFMGCSTECMGVPFPGGGGGGNGVSDSGGGGG